MFKLILLVLAPMPVFAQNVTDIEYCAGLMTEKVVTIKSIPRLFVIRIKGDLAFLRADLNQESASASSAPAITKVIGSLFETRANLDVFKDTLMRSKFFKPFFDEISKKALNTLVIERYIDNLYSLIQKNKKQITYAQIYEAIGKAAEGTLFDAAVLKFEKLRQVYSLNLSPYFKSVVIDANALLPSSVRWFNTPKKISDLTAELRNGNSTLEFEMAFSEIIYMDLEDIAKYPVDLADIEYLRKIANDFSDYNSSATSLHSEIKQLLIGKMTYDLTDSDLIKSETLNFGTPRKGLVWLFSKKETVENMIYNSESISVPKLFKTFFTEISSRSDLVRGLIMLAQAKVDWFDITNVLGPKQTGNKYLSKDGFWKKVLEAYKAVLIETRDLDPTDRDGWRKKQYRLENMINDLLEK